MLLKKTQKFNKKLCEKIQKYTLNHSLLPMLGHVAGFQNWYTDTLA